MELKDFSREKIEERGPIFAEIIKISKQARKLIEKDDTLLASKAITEVVNRYY